MAPQDYVNLKINVEGKVYDVKVEKGVSFNGIAVQTDGSVFKTETDDIYCVKTSLNKNSLKMTKGEFALFQAVANNNNEIDKTIILSKEDLESAVEMYRKGKFTKDIAKDLPEGYRTQADMQDRIGDHYFEAGAESAGKGHKMTFEYNDEDLTLGNAWQFDSSFEAVMLDGDEAIKLKVSRDKDGKLHYVSDFGSETIRYTDKNGREITENYRSVGESPYETIIKDDKKGVTIEISYGVETHTFTEEQALKTGSLADVYRNGKLSKRTFVGNKAGIDYEQYDEKGNVVERGYTQKQANKTGIRYEKYDEQGNVIMRHYAFEQIRETGIEYEIYDEQGNVIKRRYASEQIRKTGIEYEEYDEKGRIIKRECIDGLLDLEFSYDKNGKSTSTALGGALVFDDKNNLVSCNGVDVADSFDETKLSEEAKKYRTEFKNLSPKEIAKKMSEQIDGYSSNDKTLAMFDAIPQEKLLKVMEEYSLLETKPLLATMEDEWFMDFETDIMPRAQKVIAVYALQKGKVLGEYSSASEDTTKYLKQLEATVTGKPKNFFN